jgi:hypothetical protein
MVVSRRRVSHSQGAHNVMAKRKRSKVNKSEHIRQFAAENPGVQPKQIAEALTQQGIPVTAHMVSTVLYNQKVKEQGKPKARRGRKPAARVASGDNGQYSVLMEAKKFAATAGGIDAARRALEVLAKLQ